MKPASEHFSRVVGPVNNMPTIQLPPRDILAGLPTMSADSPWRPTVMHVVSRYLPTRATPGAAGHDLNAAHNALVPKRGSVVINTGCQVALPSGHYGKIEGRSSLAIKHDIVAFGGVIDEDYRGTIHVKLFNHSKKNYHIKAGERIAQMIVQRYEAPRVESVGTLSVTERGTGGFGSTGK